MQVNAQHTRIRHYLPLPAWLIRRLVTQHLVCSLRLPAPCGYLPLFARAGLLLRPHLTRTAATPMPVIPDLLVHLLVIVHAVLAEF